MTQQGSDWVGSHPAPNTLYKDFSNIHPHDDFCKESRHILIWMWNHTLSVSVDTICSFITLKTPIQTFTSEVKKAIREEFADWAEPLLKLTQVADEKDFIARSLYILPPGHRWKHKASVTLIGDAAHLMTPHAGEGVNVAMDDALKLADAIIRSAKSADVINVLDKEVDAFEDEMMKRVAKMQEHSLANTKDMFFNPKAPHVVIDSWFRQRIALQRGWIVEYVLPLWAVRTWRHWLNWWNAVH